MACEVFYVAREVKSMACEWENCMKEGKLYIYTR